MLTEAEMFECEERWNEGVPNPFLHSRTNHQQQLLSMEDMFDTEENWDEGIFLLTASRSPFIALISEKWSVHTSD